MFSYRGSSGYLEIAMNQRSAAAERAWNQAGCGADAAPEATRRNPHECLNEGGVGGGGSCRHANRGQFVPGRNDFGIKWVCKLPPRDSEIHMHLHHRDWLGIFSPTVRKRGTNYYSQGRVRIQHGSNSQVKALVRGSESYEVSLDWEVRVFCLHRATARISRIPRTLQASLGHDSCRGRAPSSLCRFRGEVESGLRRFRG